MQVSQFTHLLEHPTEIISEEQALALKNVVSSYPYFQAARGMELIGLKNTNNYHYNAALKKHAAYTSDRSWLFEIITSEAFNSPTVAALNAEQKTGAQQDPLQAKDGSLSAEESYELLENASIQKEPISETSVEEASDELSIGRPLHFNKNERHSFEQWLSLSKPLAPSESKKKEQGSALTSTKAPSSKAFKMAKIDAFLANAPKIDAQKSPAQNIEIKDPHKINKEALMTETLARVYLEQKKYKKALQAYKILSLKYPEKNSFFTSEIKSIQKLIKDK